MRILVAGAGFANKGAEAMTLTLRQQLLRRMPGLELLFWDCPATHADLAGANGYVPLRRPAPGGSAAKVAWMLRRELTHGGLHPAHLLHPGTLWPDFSAAPMLEAAGDVGALVDISGFAYGDAWGAEPARSTLPAVRLATDRGLPVVFMPQAWGSFERPAVRDAVAVLTGGSNTLVFARDAQSKAHLDSAGLPAGAVAMSSDIVFAFEGATELRGLELLRAMGCSAPHPVVAFAPNMRAYERTAGEGSDNEYVRSLVQLVRHCVDTHDMDVALLPFECAPFDRGTDDRRLCAIVRQAAERDSRCHTSREYVSAEDMWAMVGACEYLVGSRYHSVVFALSQGVPCTVLGWSHKYAELMSTFDSADDCVSLEHVGERGVTELFEAGWTRRETRRGRILQTADGLRADTQHLFDEVARFLSKRGRDGDV